MPKDICSTGNFACLNAFQVPLGMPRHLKIVSSQNGWNFNWADIPSCNGLVRLFKCWISQYICLIIRWKLNQWFTLIDNWTLWNKFESTWNKKIYLKMFAKWQPFFRSSLSVLTHDDVIKWKHFPCYWPIVRWIHWCPVNSPHKGQWHGALMVSLICVFINGSVNNREAGDMRRYHAPYDVIVMTSCAENGIIWVN